MAETNYKEPLLTFALDASGRMVSIENVDNGLACNCFCPKCKQPLIAKNEGKTRQKHFAHQGEYGENRPNACHDYYITAIHLLAEQIIRDRKSVMVPEYKGVKEAHRVVFSDVEVEERKDRFDLQPDIVGITEKGDRLLVEIRNTSKVSPDKENKIKADGLVCMEIDVSETSLDKLESFLLFSSEHRKWINNPVYERILEENKRKKDAAKEAAHDENKTISPVDEFFSKLKANVDFLNYNGMNTMIINYNYTISGNGVVVLHGDKSSPALLHLTLVTFPNGMPNYSPRGDFNNMIIAEQEYNKLKSRGY